MKKTTESIVGRKYKVMDNSWTVNISNFRDNKKPTITCACEASNERFDIVEVITDPFDIVPVWILKNKTKSTMIIVKSIDGEFYSTFFHPNGLI